MGDPLSVDQYDAIMWLRFIRSGAKWYGRTPDGEIAFGDHSGLYRWMHDDEGNLIRVDYVGSDRQISADGHWWTSLSSNEPFYRGVKATMPHCRLN